MGLDMYLKARKYISTWNDEDKELHAQLTKLTKAIGKGFEFDEIGFTAIYWRKANAIHKWFVDNVQDGKDDCGEYSVGEEDLRKLLDVVTRVLDDRSLAQELLPPQSGFFFGSTDVDDWYWQDIKVTKDKLTKLLDRFEEGEIGWDWSFVYRASW